MKVTTKQTRVQHSLWAFVVLAAMAAAIFGCLSIQGGDHDAPSLKTPFTVDPHTAATATGGEKGQCGQLEMNAPNRLYIPALCISAPLDQVGLKNQGMDLPRDPRRVGLLSASADLDATEGETLIAGHINYSHVNGALWRLSAARAGDLVVVTDETGTPSRWRVYAAEQIHKKRVPVSLTGRRELTVISCAGKVIRGTGGNHYEDNILIHTVPERAAKKELS